MSTAEIDAPRISLHRSFDATGLDRRRWNGHLAGATSDVVFLTWGWQTAWWHAFGRGTLLISVAEANGEIVAVAPMFADGGMLFVVGSGGSDQLDVIWHRASADLLARLLQPAIDAVDDFVGIRLYHVPAHSPTLSVLEAAAIRLGLVAVHEGSLPAPVLHDEHGGGSLVAAADRTSLRRHTRWFQREGALAIDHVVDATQAHRLLPALVDQHRRRWQDTPTPSLFEDPTQVSFYADVIDQGAIEGWLRVTCVTWRGTPVALHLGSVHAGRFLWYKPTFEVALARRSPGEVLLRHLLLRAAEEGVAVFDFGIGDEAFKLRFASDVPTVETWGLYPPAVLG